MGADAINGDAGDGPAGSTDGSSKSAPGTIAVVTAGDLAATRGTLRYGAHCFACALGRSGRTRDKREGDGATPIGRLPMRRVLWRPDRLQRPVSRLPSRPISPDDGWCDAPDDPRYNQSVLHPYPSSAERLWLPEGLYDIIVVLGHNDAPVVPGAGSAIFLHVARDDYGPTAGCIALAREHLLALLAAESGPTALEVLG
jgi:L,D-peptidoglycan transpeptidase YkuD (ErfK/YbiS/YcfS/YnhG family)